MLGRRSWDVGNGKSEGGKMRCCDLGVLLWRNDFADCSYFGYSRLNGRIRGT